MTSIGAAVFQVISSDTCINQYGEEPSSIQQDLMVLFTELITMVSYDIIKMIKVKLPIGLPPSLCSFSLC